MHTRITYRETSMSDQTLGKTSFLAAISTVAAEAIMSKLALREIQLALGFEPDEKIKSQNDLVEAIGMRPHRDVLARSRNLNDLYRRYRSHVEGPPQHRVHPWEKLLDKKWDELHGNSVRWCLTNGDIALQKRAIPFMYAGRL